jgi:hypothetical protein
MTNNFRNHYRTKDGKVLELFHGSNSFYFIITVESEYHPIKLKNYPFLKVTALELIREIFIKEKLFKIKTTVDFYTLSTIEENFGEVDEQFEKMSIINIAELLNRNSYFTIEYDSETRVTILKYLEEKSAKQ